ncbi:MAG: methyltransferase domain-containing protein [Bacteroidota bacterium]|nr:methyltransferase domain-containing protein [Bacteroidota bacterium]
MNFSQRSYQKELLDRDDIPFEDIKQNMQELEFINKYLGGHRITIEGFRTMIAGTRKRLQKNKNIITICEIGCGGGDNLKVIDHWCRKNNIETKFIGIDINKECIQYARQNTSQIQRIELITADYKKIQFDKQKPDIIFSSLFCHHFNDAGLIEILDWSRQNAELGFFINDLQRHPLAYFSIKALTKLFSSSYLVKNDAPLSVKKGFTKKELEDLFKQANISHYQIKWKWAFRWLILAKKIDLN